MELMTKGVVALCSLILVTSVFAARPNTMKSGGGFPVTSLTQLDPKLASGESRYAVVAVSDGKGGVKQRMMDVYYSPKSHRLGFMLDRRSSMTNSLLKARVSVFFFANKGLTQVVFEGKAQKVSSSGYTEAWSVTPDNIYMMAASKASGGKMSGKAMAFVAGSGAWKQSDRAINWPSA